MLYQYRKVALQVVLTTLVMISLCLPVAAADVNIEWWIGGLEAQKQAANSLAETWMEDNPNYTFDIMDVGGWYDVHTKVMTSIAAGTLPHLVRGKDFWLVDWVQGDFLLELDEYIERDKDELGWGPMFMELLEKCRYDGKIKALPWHQYFHSLYWNKTLFAEAGLSSPPDTWEEMIEYGKKLTRPEKDIYGFQMYIYERDLAVVSVTLETFARQASDTPHLELWDVSQDVPVYNLVTPAAKEALQFWLDAMYVHQVCVPPELSTMPRRKEDSKVGFWIACQDNIPWLEVMAPDLDYGVAVLPKNKNRAGVVEHNFMYPFNRDPEEVWDFLKYICGPEGNLVWSRGSGTLPTHEEMWTQSPFNTAEYEPVIAQRNFPETVVHKYHPHYEEVQEAIAEEVEQIMYRRKTVDQGLNDAQKRVDALMKKYFGDAYKK